MSRVSSQDWSHIPARLPDEGFHQLYKRDEDDDHHDKPQQKRTWKLIIPPLRKLFRELATKQKPWPLYLHGIPSQGKTRAALAFCDKVHGARYWMVSDVMASIRDSPPWTYWGVHLAVLDEIGNVRTGEGWNLDYEVVTNFFEWRQDRPSIYISNHPFEELEKLYDPRVSDRLASGTEYKLVDRDRRRR